MTSNAAYAGFREFVLDLPDIGVGLQDIVSTGRKTFELSGTALDDFVRGALLQLMAHRARPTRKDGPPETSWDIATSYGHEPEDIARNVIAAWHALDRPLGWSDFRFATPELAAEYRKSMFDRD